MRMLVYTLLNGHTSTAKVPPFLRQIGDIYGQQMDLLDIPSRTTVERMQLEVVVISDLQVAEFMLDTPNLTIAFDATTQAGVHVNAINIHNSNNEYVVALDELAGGRSEDYGNHLVSTVKLLAKFYSSWKDLNFCEVRKKMIDNITNTLTDRYAVNKSSIQEVEKSWSKPTRHNNQCSKNLPQ